MTDHLIIFHYHFLPGGVTQVILESVRSVICNIPTIKKITLICGREDNTGKFLSDCKENNPENASVEIICRVLPEFDYTVPGNQTDDHISVLKKSFSAFDPDAVWWIHNYHLGKNPPFTQVLLEWIQDHQEQKILLHIHDFPECSRYDNLTDLQAAVKLPLYPKTKNIRYITINSRDRSILIASGLPENQVFLLNDPVEEYTREDIDPEQTRKAVREYFGTKDPLLFFPVRTIRRKNVLEAGLLSRLCLNPAFLIVTLPGISEKEKPYSDVVEDCFNENLIRGAWGTGVRTGTPPFADLISAVDAVISSSVQEGFGYLFINALQWRKPLIARSLPILEGITGIFAGHPHFFYPGVNVPADRQEKKELRKQYKEKFKKLTMHLPPEILKPLSIELEEILGKDSIDFSYLSVPQQVSILRKIEDSGFRKEISSGNREVLRKIEGLIESGGTDFAERVNAVFGLSAFANELERIFDSFNQELIIAHQKETDIERNIITHFARLENLRLLYE